MSLLRRLFPRPPEYDALPLYQAIVERGRAPHWYLDGGVADSVDGRFDMIAAVLSLVLLRLEDEPDARVPSVLLTERFVDDMDGQLRLMGVGDMIVGKRMGQMMGMLGGRLGAYRDALAAGDLDPALVRNLYRGATPHPAALAHTRDRLLAFRDALHGTSTAAILANELPR